jgi:hypothetical protein
MSGGSRYILTLSFIIVALFLSSETLVAMVKVTRIYDIVKFLTAISRRTSPGSFGARQNLLCGAPAVAGTARRHAALSAATPPKTMPEPTVPKKIRAGCCL